MEAMRRRQLGSLFQVWSVMLPTTAPLTLGSNRTARSRLPMHYKLSARDFPTRSCKSGLGGT